MCRNRDVDNAIRKSLVERGYDDWALAVLCRIESVNELRVEDAVYHKTCNSNFRTRKNRPAKHCDVTYSDGNRKRGRPKNISWEAAYVVICNRLKEKELEDEQVTLPELGSLMNEMVLGSGKYIAYTTKYLKKRLLEDFQGEIVITNVNGKPDVVTFISTLSKIFTDFHKFRSSDNLEDEKFRVIQAAATIIRNDIKSLENNTMT